MDVIEKTDPVIHRPQLLRVMIQIRQWEMRQPDELQTMSGRDLYLRLAASLLQNDGKPQALKSLQGDMTERAIRIRIKEFQKQGLIELDANQFDQRTKRAVPTEKFVNRLNQHLDLLMHLCEQEFFMIDKS